MSKPDALIAVIILNWNGRDDTAECLASLEKVTYGSFRVIVVDNGSTDGSVAMLRERFGDVEIIENGRNLGYAEGNNVGMRRALAEGADFVLLLNNDTTVEPDFLSVLVLAARADERIGIIGPQINRYDPRDRVWFAGGKICPWIGWSWHTGNHGVDRGQFTGIVDEDYQTGACMLISRTVLESAGLFDADYVSYCEDADLSLRAKRAGYRVVCCRDAKILHKISGSTGGGLTPHKAYRKILSGARFYRKRSGALRYYTTVAAFNYTYAAATAAWCLLHGKFAVVSAICRGFLDLWRGRDRDLEAQQRKAE